MTWLTPVLWVLSGAAGAGMYLGAWRRRFGQVQAPAVAYAALCVVGGPIGLTGAGLALIMIGATR